MWGAKFLSEAKEILDTHIVSFPYLLISSKGEKRLNSPYQEMKVKLTEVSNYHCLGLANSSPKVECNFNSYSSRE